MQASSPARLQCPKCLSELVTYERQGVHLERCRDCRGIWLDRGELDRLIDAEVSFARGPGYPPSETARRPGWEDDDDRDRRSWSADDDDDDDDRRRWRHDDDRSGRRPRRRSLFGELFEGLIE
jgi:Zn-finger nucleic acid-binding protein